MRLPIVVRTVSLCLTLVLLLFSPHVNFAAQAPQEGDPTLVLRSILMAACSHDAMQFSNSLTARNAAAFAQMTPAAQTTLLKRLVLLDNAGTPRSEADPDGNLTVFCVTPEVTSQLRIGKGEVHDNLAYLPLAAKDVTDTSDANVRRVLMGLVRENGQWKLLSLGLLLLDLPTLGEEWDRAEIQSNEKSAIASINTLAVAIEKYRVTYTHLPQSLAELGPPTKGAANNSQAGLVDSELASGRKDGYSFRYVIVGANDVGAPAIFQLAAVPIEYGRTGTRSFLRDGAGLLRGADHQGAVGTLMDPKVE